MKKDCNESPEVIVPLGQALKDARLVVPLSIDEVAEKLNLSGTAVRDIEDNLAHILEIKKYPVIYLRGYLANYAKLVGLNTLDLFIEYQQLAVVQKSKTLPPSKLIIPHPKKRSKLIPFSLFVVVIAGIGFYLTQQSAPLVTEQAHVEQTERKELPALSNALIVPNTAQDSTPDTASDTAQLNNQAAVIDAAQQPEVLTPQAVTINSAVVAEKSEQNTNAPIVAAPQESVPVVSAPVSTQEVAEEVVAEVIAQDVEEEIVAEVITHPVAVEKEKVAANIESLSLSFSAECWTEVFDATGKRVAYGLYKAGRVLKLQGVAPFQLKLGDPSVVAIEYKNQAIDGGFTPGRTARFNVPLS